MTSETDPLGYTISFTYNQFAEPLTFVNQKGYMTSYQYDPNGNLLDNDQPRRHDPAIRLQLPGRGDVVDRRRRPDDHATHITPTASSRPKTCPTARRIPTPTTRHGNMLTADGPGGDWSFTYNSQNLPTTIVEPYGTLTVQYGIDGNVTQIVDQTGFTINYVYDAVGRLSELTDAQRQPDRVVFLRPGRKRHQRDQGQRHEHDLPVQRRRRDHQITNLAPGGTINSQMTYVYNAVGEVTARRPAA